jgi:hypothetical protein
MNSGIVEIPGCPLTRRGESSTFDDKIREFGENEEILYCGVPGGRLKPATNDRRSDGFDEG